MNFLIIYLFGVVASGLLMILTFKDKDFYNYFVKVLNDILNDNDTDELSKSFINQYNADTILKLYIGLNSLLSWLQVLIVVFTYIEVKFHR